MALDTWLLFLLTSLGMSLSPGPNGLLALTHGAMHGSRKTLFTIAGGIVGFNTVIALCLFGIGALLKSSLVWLTVLKWTGGAYLIWLGIKLWRSPATTYEHASVIHDSHAWPLFGEGWPAPHSAFAPGWPAQDDASIRCAAVFLLSLEQDYQSRRRQSVRHRRFARSRCPDRSAVRRIAWRAQGQLVEGQIEPAAKFEAHLRQRAHASEAKAFVQREIGRAHV